MALHDVHQTAGARGEIMVSSRPERIQKAQTLLSPAIPGPGGVWADIGCGDGIFTSALHRLIGPEGEVYAVDEDADALKRLARYFAQHHPEAAVHTVQADFTGLLDLPALDGLVMANALHFVEDKVPVLRRLASLLKPGGRLILVEYNARRGNFAVPFPLDEVAFLELAVRAGLQAPRIVSRIPSSFLGEMYAGVAIVGS